MSKNVISLDIESSLIQAEKLFKKYKIRHLPITDKDQIVGILSENDLLRISFVDAYIDCELETDRSVYNLLTLDQIMVKNPVCIQDTSSIDDVTRILLNKDFHALPVLAGSNLVGMLTTTDLLKFFLSEEGV
ncbi:CBS domain-containing protein [Flavobacteriaceae bacterium]|nr:CBS domain-containing protein [Flavobacteriaceae bacterium]